MTSILVCKYNKEYTQSRMHGNRAKNRSRKDVVKTTLPSFPRNGFGLCATGRVCNFLLHLRQRGYSIKRNSRSGYCHGMLTIFVS